MSSSRPRTGLKRKREIERALLEAQWRDRRENGQPPIKPSEPDDEALPSLIGTGDGVDVFGGMSDLPRLPDMAALNDFASTLYMLSAMHPDASFAAAFDDLQRLGLTGPGLAEAIRHEEQWQWDKITGLPLVPSMVEGELARGSSLERALERTAAELGNPSQSFDGAVQAVKRVWLGFKKTSRP